MKLDSVVSTSAMRNISNDNSSNIKGQSTDMQNQKKKFNMNINNQNELTSEKISEKTIKEAIEKANKKLVLADRKFEFTVNEETKDIIVKVVDKETDEVIREIPSEKILDMVAKMMELAGLFVDERR